jgi:hypothetical protein
MLAEPVEAALAEGHAGVADVLWEALVQGRPEPERCAPAVGRARRGAARRGAAPHRGPFSTGSRASIPGLRCAAMSLRYCACPSVLPGPAGLWA